MKKWVWIDSSLIPAVHDEQIAEHGGAAGLRDPGLLESALARPPNLAAYGKPDHADLAACYGVGVARSLPYLDGNKRTALLAVELFLILNGWQLNAADTDAVLTMFSVAAGKTDEAAFAEWIRQHSKKIK